MEYYSAMRKDEIMQLTSSRMELANVLLSKVSPKGNNNCKMIALMCEIKRNKGRNKTVPKG